VNNFGGTGWVCSQWGGEKVGGEVRLPAAKRIVVENERLVEERQFARDKSKKKKKSASNSLPGEKSVVCGCGSTHLKQGGYVAFRST